MFGLPTELVNWPPQRDSSSDVTSVSPSAERIKEL